MKRLRVVLIVAAFAIFSFGAGIAVGILSGGKGKAGDGKEAQMTEITQEEAGEGAASAGGAKGANATAGDAAFAEADGTNATVEGAKGANASAGDADSAQVDGANASAEGAKGANATGGGAASAQGSGATNGNQTGSGTDGAAGAAAGSAGAAGAAGTAAGSVGAAGAAGTAGSAGTAGGSAGTAGATAGSAEAGSAPQTDYSGVDFVSTESSMYTYEQMMTDLEEMANAFPTLLTVNICGTSLDGRAIPEAVLGNQGSGRNICIQASIHAREYINTLVAMEQIEQMLTHHADGSYSGVSYDELLSSVCFHILPMSNPDGVTISQMGIDGIRDESLKEILRNCYQNDLDNGRTSSEMDYYWATWKANARGVDLNRNFDAGWETYEGVYYPSSDHYKGEAPVSEPETRAIVDAVHACGAVLTISYHSTGSVIYWDYGSTGEVYEQDAALVNLVESVTGYAATSSVQSSQDAAGCSDYFVLAEGIPSVTIENGYGACPIDIGEFPGIWYSNADLLPALALSYR